MITSDEHLYADLAAEPETSPLPRTIMLFGSLRVPVCNPTRISSGSLPREVRIQGEASDAGEGLTKSREGPAGLAVDGGSTVTSALGHLPFPSRRPQHEAIDCSEHFYSLFAWREASLIVTVTIQTCLFESMHPNSK